MVGICGMHAEDESDGGNVLSDHLMVEDKVAILFQPGEHGKAILNLIECEVRHHSEVELEMLVHRIRLEVVNKVVNFVILWDFACHGTVSGIGGIGGNATIFITSLQVGDEGCENRCKVDCIIVSKR